MAAGTYYPTTGADRTANMIQAMKNLSMIGALIIFFVLGPLRPATNGYRDRNSDSPY